MVDGIALRQEKPIPTSLHHLAFFPTTSGEKYPTIIAIHGRGTDENDLVPLVASLGLPQIMLIAPRAPFPFPYGGFAWYNLSQEEVPDHEMLRVSLGLLQRFIGEVSAGYPIDPQRLLLLGFSQGTVMAYATALLDPKSFVGIAALSGYIPHRSGLSLELTKLNGLPVFISHGTLDQLIPIRLARASRDLLEHAGANLTYREYHMGHEVSEDTIRDLKAWASRVLS
jgi:phospholipase/carboxylesterase